MSGGDVRRLTDWDGAHLRSLAAKYGTPLYVVDLERVRSNAQRVCRAFPDAHIQYAVKAHTGHAVLKTVREAGLDAECASAGEVARAFDAGYGANDIQYTAVNPPDKDLDYIVDCWRENNALTVTVGARDTLLRLSERGYDGRLCIRVNPGVGAGHHEMVQTGKDAKFGVPYDRAADVVAEARDYFDVIGLHAHAGSGIDVDQLENHRELVQRMGTLAREVGDLEFVDVGGGFGVPYRKDEPPFDLRVVADATREAIGEISAQLAIEPGRYIVADAGVLLTTVNTIKPAPKTTIVGVDAGMTTLLRPALYDAFHPMAILADRGDSPITVTGPICESSDVFCTDRPLGIPKRDDVIAIGNAGAYGYEMASTYNSRPRPAEIALANGTSRIVRQRETLADLTRLEKDEP